MKRYLRFATNLIQQTLFYKANLALEIFGKCLGFFILVFLWLHLAASRGAAFHFSAGEIMTYFLIMELMNTTKDTKIFFELQSDISTGRIGQTLLLPLSMVWLFIIKNITRICTLFVLYSIPITLVLLFVPGFFLPTSLTTYGLFLCTTIFSIATGAGLILFFGSITFWTVETSNAIWAVIFTIDLLGGRLIPLPLFPSQLQTILGYLPMVGIFHLPGMVFLNKLPLSELTLHIFVQIVWIIAIYTGIHHLWKKGIHKMEVVGS